ncbi:hypothetical protein DPM19_27460 [Actinomadura craniellae]|uniref:Uncharacterized protein n=1 Tax=Actinomadura craniellae TaxID=2231787 RepID=A0A365GZ83_9ACTN|nr:hypothetical protein [Actinomadura craniellae]RAY12078.1 hypothetical protein DPM19_27460 [Actinomadura craniellae]
MRDPGRPPCRHPAIEPGRLARLVVVALGVLGFGLLPGFASPAIAGLHEAASAKSALSGKGGSRTAGHTRPVKRAELAPPAHQRTGVPAHGSVAGLPAEPAVPPPPAVAPDRAAAVPGGRPGGRPGTVRGRAPPFLPGS